ncbi:MAG: hypothetical protein II276_00755, partial [Bacteroidales bacterium]|nr:hypothetical protein [Bacteroidales bacterium]
MEVRAKKALGQHFLTDQRIAEDIVNALQIDNEQTADAGTGADGAKRAQVLEVGPGMGVLTRHLLQREDIDFRAVEIDRESVDYL